MFFCVASTSCEKRETLYTVSFDSNGGSFVVPQTVKGGERATKPEDPTRHGYQFMAWYRDAGFTTEWIFDVQVVTADITLYARWFQDLFTVTFDSNGGSAVLPQTVELFRGVIKPEDPTRSEHLFAAWYRDPELTSDWKFDPGYNYVYADMTLYAKWNPMDTKFKIDGLSVDNYPRVDGSTSTTPLNVLVACKLLDIGYYWSLGAGSNTRTLEPNLKDNSDKFWERVKSSQTHESFINLIDDQAELILSAREMSPDEQAYAHAASVSLIETPIARDALVFIVHPTNPIKTLTTRQIQDIYTGKITNWKEVGGLDFQINPYIRNANSGSQELMESLVMKGLDIADFPASYNELLIFSMVMVFEVVITDPFAICYSIHYYKENMISGIPVKTIAVDGIYPDKESISDNSYPHVADVVAAIRSDIDKSSMAYKLYQLLQTEEGKRVITESGYVPYDQLTTL